MTKIELPSSFDLGALAEQLGITDPTAKEFLRVALENTLLMQKKHQDYGPGNIAGYGTFGVVVRMHDKFSRLQNLLKTKRKANNESVQDTFRDISNYAIIALLFEKGLWPR